MKPLLVIAALVAVAVVVGPSDLHADAGGGRGAAHPGCEHRVQGHGRGRCHHFGLAAAPAALAVVAPRVVPLRPEFAPDLLMLRFRHGVSSQEQARTLSAAGVTVDRRIAAIGVVVVRVAPARRDRALARLRGSTAVARVERDEVIHALDTTPNDTDWPQQWGLRQIGLPKAWDASRGTPGLAVAVLDTGVDPTQPDLSGALLPGINVVAGGHDTSDLDGHGTAVAGVIAARTDNLRGVAGVCWSCSILPVKVLGDDGTGTMDALAAGVVQATNQGARIISMSLGGPADSGALDEAISYASAHDVVLVAAAGNDGSTAPFYPAALPNVIGVAATDESGRLYSWSNSGPWVRMTAPGCDPATSLHGTFVMFCGTSAATPVVAGIVALARSVRPNASASEIVQAVTQPAAGRADAASSLAALTGSSAATPPAAAPSPSGTAGATFVSWTLRGSLTPRLRLHWYRRALGSGALTAILRFPRGAVMRLSVAGKGTRRPFAVVSGRSPLRIRRAVRAGTFVFSVSGRLRARTRYSLVIRAPRAAP